MVFPDFIIAGALYFSNKNTETAFPGAPEIMKERSVMASLLHSAMQGYGCEIRC